MSSLYKLSILGVRSFSPKDHETIQFGSPLTLICGQNGCGKTTIIECLKYATTGDLPPNSKGGAFVNDPAIADRLMVNAEIKLGFVSVDGKLMTVTRNMQLTRKRIGRGQAGASNTFKTLEGQLAVISRGQKTAISTKNLELDTRVPLYLGASKAILEYVIFCHQDDSLWPLSEAGVLKKRFDEIFEALKFTKVLENLKVIRKDMAADIKLIEQSVQYAKVDKVRAQKIKEKLAESTSKVDQYSEQIANLTMEIERLEKQADDLFHSNQSFQKTLSEYDRLKVVLENTHTIYERLKNSIDILPDSDEELAHQLANFADIQEQKGKEFDEKEFENALVIEEIQESQNAYHSLTRDEGFLANKKEEYQTNQLKFGELKRALKEYNISEDESRELIVQEMRKLLEYANDRYKRICADSKAKQMRATSSLREVQDKIAQEEQHKAYCLNDIKSTTDKVKDLKSKLSSLSSNEVNMEVEKSQLEALKTKLERKLTSSSVKQLQQQIEDDNSKISLLELELDDLMRKINTANKQSDLYSKIDLLKDAHSVKSDVIDKSTESNKKGFRDATGEELNAVNCETLLDSKIHESFTAMEESLKVVKEIDSKINSCKAFVNSHELALLEVESKTKLCFTKILGTLEEREIPEYESLLKELEEDHKTAVYNVNTFDVTKSYKIKAIEVAKQSKCCTLCNRGFDNPEVEHFIKELQANINSLTAEKLQDDLKNTTEDLEAMKAINFDVLQYRKLKEDAFAMASETVTKKKELENLTKEQDGATQILESTKAAYERLSELKKPIDNLARIAEENLALEKQIADLVEELNDYGASSLSMAELQKLQQIKSAELKALRQSIADAAEGRTSQQKDISRLEGQIKDKELVISNLKISFNESINLKNTITDSEAHIETIKEKQYKIETILSDLRVKDEEKSSELQKVIKECLELESSSAEELTSLKEKTTSVQKVHDDIILFEERDEELVKKNSEQLLKTKQKMEELNTKKSDLETSIKQLQKTINEATQIERNIQDNLEFRNAEKELDQIQHRMEELNTSNAEVERENYQVASKALRDQITELNSEHFGKVGEVKQINDQIQQLQEDLNTEFKDIDKLYHKEWIKLQTNLLVSNDLQTYSQALDNAIMKYHSMKMDEINRIVRELWNQTYKGTDIDSIEIKCDVNTLARARSYNYRVVMYKKNSELDMRGRCSAGQKVLTSILIRLALAECFGTNCGMIALDEPTTNLDVENAESLAMALNNIIDFRKNQKNFQLIVITHDERFLSHMNGDRYTDNFYRISRDENQHSIIKSVPIHLMQDD